MKAALLLLFMFIGAGASAQQRAVLVRAPLTLISKNPLVLLNDPVGPYTNRAAVVANPATSSLTVDFKEGIPKQRITIAIDDKAGKVLQSETFVPEEREHTTSFGQPKASGSYIIAVYGEDNKVLYWNSLTK